MESPLLVSHQYRGKLLIDMDNARPDHAKKTRTGEPPHIDKKIAVDEWTLSRPPSLKKDGVSTLPYRWGDVVAKKEDKEKCFLYYPTSLGSSITIESTCITLLERSSDDALTRSLWNVKCRETEFQVRHVQCSTWPDHSAPLDAAAALEIHKEISNSPPSYPILVHCSAGVGRTCTVVGIELMLERIRSRRFQSGTSVVRTMRRARYGAVQKPIQFLFMHLALLELFCTEGVFRSDNRLMVSFREAYSSLITKAEEIRKRRQKNSKPGEESKPREVAAI